MYSFLLDHFEQHVTGVLLNPESKFAHLAIGHAKFLSYVRLEYHRTTRKFIHQAVEAVKYARFAKMEYVSHNICHYLRILVESFPRNIKNNEINETPLAEKDPLRLIFDSGSFLPENRNPQTGDYLPATSNVVYDIFTTTRGLVLHDITINFFANVVANIQRYNTIIIPNALRDRITKMPNKELAHMCHVDLSENIEEFQMVFEKLKALEQTYDDIEYYIQLFDGKIIPQSDEKKQKSKDFLHEKRDRDHRKVLNKLDNAKIEDNLEENLNEQFHDYNKDESELRTLSNDPDLCYKLLNHVFRRDDVDDLKFSFLEDDDFHINKKKKAPANRRSSVRSPPPSTAGQINPITTTNPGLAQSSSKELTTAASNDSEETLSSISDYLYSENPPTQSTKPRQTRTLDRLFNRGTARK